MYPLERSENLIHLPYLNPEELESLKQELHKRQIQDHVVISSSGTTGGNWKAYLISTKAMKKNAEAVNLRLSLGADDVWGLTLPDYHIGGLSIYFRAALLGKSPVNLRPWSAEDLVQKIQKHHVTVISLVPTQVYDLVKLQARCPNNLRVVLVGGDFLSKELEKRFVELGWPLIRTFGMTEVCSQLCTGTNPADEFEPLPIHELKTDSDDFLFVKSQSFFSAIITKTQSWDFVSIDQLTDEEGFLKLADKARLTNGRLQVLGREDGHLKVSGHLVNLNELKEILERLCLENQCWGSMELSSEKSERQGHELVLNCLDSVPAALIDTFLSTLLPLKISKIVKHQVLPRTALGKFIKPTTPFNKQDNYGN